MKTMIVYDLLCHVVSNESIFSAILAQRRCCTHRLQFPEFIEHFYVMITRKTKFKIHKNCV